MLHHLFHIKGDVDRLYVSRRMGGRGLLSGTETISSEERNLSAYAASSSERLLQQVPCYIHLQSGVSGAEYKRQVQSEHYDAFVDKQLHGQYFREIHGQVDNKYQWAWLAHRGFTPDTEGLIMALQEQAVSTNLIKCSIYRLPVSPSYRLWHSYDESVDHLLSSCTFLVHIQYK